MRATVPKPLPPRGVEHHYAPLAWIAVAPNGTVEVTGVGVAVLKEVPAGRLAVAVLGLFVTSGR